MINREKMVAIAKDVLAQIATENYIATRNRYVVVNFADDCSVNLTTPSDHDVALMEEKFESIWDEISAKEMKKKAQSCNVCALGAMAMSAVDKWNGTVVPFVAEPWEKLAEYTTEKQIALIEMAFEGRDNGLIADESYWVQLDQNEDGEYDYRSVNDGETISFEEWNQAQNMFRNSIGKIEEQEYVIKEIMRNIIRNNGEFRIDPSSAQA